MSENRNVGRAGASRLGVLLALLALAAGAYWWMGREEREAEVGGENRLEEIRAAAEGGDSVAALRLGRLYAEGLEVGQDWQQAASWYRKAAQAGDPEGAYQLGWLFAEGKGVGQDWRRALEWYRKAAGQGHADAEWQLGLCYRDGHGVGQDAIWAKIWLEKAARHGQTEAKEALAQLAAAVDPATMDRALAEGGDASAQCRMGRRYLEGDGVEKDEAAGVEWFRKAAEHGNAEAQCRLGDCLRTGRGTEKNEEEAERWYRAAADQGHAAGQRLMGRIRMAAGDRIGAVMWLQKAAEGGDAEGQYLLAVCYQKGVGTEKNPALAKSWLQTAATNGHAAAKTSLAALEGGGTGEGLSALARRGNRKAQYELGRQWMEKGREKEGLALLQEAAQGGYAAAAMWLGRHYAGKDPQQSFYWWHRAADTGSPEAQWQMVDLCRRGTGTRPSDTDAFRWAQKAAEGGNLQAIRLVAHCFEKGIGCRQDYAEARRWYARAGDQSDVNRMTRLITGRTVGSSYSTTEKRGIYHYRDQYGRRHTVTVSK